MNKPLVSSLSVRGKERREGLSQSKTNVQSCRRVSGTVLRRLQSYKKIPMCVTVFVDFVVFVFFYAVWSVGSCSIVTGYDYLKFTAR